MKTPHLDARTSLRMGRPHTDVCPLLIINRPQLVQREALFDTEARSGAHQGPYGWRLGQRMALEGSVL